MTNIGYLGFKNTGGANQWVKEEGMLGFARVNQVLPYPLDTHFQFSIKTLLSKQSNAHKL